VKPGRDPAGCAALRRDVLGRLGGGGAAVDEVLAYCESPFTAVLVPSPVFPLPDEPHLEDWRRYAAEAGSQAFAYLQERLPQLAIPVREGVSKTPAWTDVVLAGKPFREVDFGGRLSLEHPERLSLFIHEHPAGALPVIVAGHRGDFETLVRALAARGEPVPIGPAVNAQMVAGFINWDRLGRYRAGWLRGAGPEGEGLWPGEMARLGMAERWRFQDRFVLTCAQPYSGVPARELGLAMDEQEWLAASTRLRVEHEFTHYATKRVFGHMSLNLLDETFSDFMGTTYALGTFRAAWYLRFLGIDDGPARARPDGRIHTYASKLSPPALALLCAVTAQAARALETLCARFYAPSERGRFLLALAGMTLETLAADEAPALFAESYEAAGRLTGAQA
jgi:hypothetical protein